MNLDNAGEGKEDGVANHMLISSSALHQEGLDGLVTEHFIQPVSGNVELNLYKCDN